MSTNSVIESNLSAVQEGLKVLRSIDAEHYQYIDKPAFSSSVGSHFRHVIEHYRCFLNQLSGKEICYDARERDACLEVDLVLAIDAFEELEKRLQNLDSSFFEKPYVLQDGISDKPVTTSVARELLFLQSHTVHHYAVIGAMLRKLNIEIDKDFGVATATLVHERMQSEVASEEQKICAQ